MVGGQRSPKRKTSEIIIEVLQILDAAGDEGVSRTRLKEVTTNRETIKGALELLERVHAIEYRKPTNPRQKYGNVAITAIGRAMLTGEIDEG